MGLGVLATQLISKQFKAIEVASRKVASVTLLKGRGKRQNKRIDQTPVK